MNLNIGLPPKSLKGVTSILKVLLADEFILYTQTLNNHWNVEGPHFHDLHKFFESQYSELSEMVDSVAERIRSLGDKAPASLSKFLELGRIKEGSKIQDLLKNHENIIQSLRKDLEECNSIHQDAGTTDFLTGLMEKHEKMAWMLRAILS